MKKLLCSLAMAASIASAQSAAQVRLTVTALDSTGAPIEDLKPGDLQVADQGKAEQILFMRRTTPAASTAPLAPHEFSNRPGPAPHSTAILFDLLNENTTERLDVWHKLGKSLQQLDSGESVYLYLLTLEGTIQPIHEVGGKDGDDKTWTQNIEKVLDKAMKAASHARPVQMNDQEAVVKSTYVGLEKIANQMALLPGPRDIIWITSGTPNVWNTKNPCSGDWIDCALYVPHLAVTLAGANVAVDPLSFTSSPSPDLNRDLELVSNLTGGMPYYGQDIRAVLKDVARADAASYSIVYEPSADNWDSKFHKVRITAGKGLKFRARLRYYALPDKRPDAERQMGALKPAFLSPYDDPGIGLRVTVAPGADAKNVKVQIRIDAADLLLHPDGDKVSGGVTFLIADRGAAGPIGDPVVIGSPIHLSKDQLAAAMKDGIPLTQDHAVTDAVQKIRVIVLDQGSNVAGSLTVPAR
jgi:VWFA-related protein